jgi:hypothetical protein
MSGEGRRVEPQSAGVKVPCLNLLGDSPIGLIHKLAGPPVLADKAYAGASGEAEYKKDKESAKAFNRGLSKIRVKVEHAFARLKTWRVIAGIFPYRWERLGDFMWALAVVYNMNRENSEAKR